MLKIIFLSVFVFLLISSSCSKLQNTNKSYLNHKAMNLDKGLTDEAGKAFTNMGGGSASSSAGCTTCAK